MIVSAKFQDDKCFNRIAMNHKVSKNEVPVACKLDGPPAGNHNIRGTIRPLLMLLNCSSAAPPLCDGFLQAALGSSICFFYKEIFLYLLFGSIKY